MRLARWILLTLVVLASLGRASAAPVAPEFPPGLQVPAGAQPGPGFDVEKATDAYIALLSPAQRARSDAYFEGNYWLQLWDFLYGLAIAAALLLTGLSRWARDFAQRVSPRPWLYTLIYAVLWIAAGFVLSLPFAIYAGFFREHEYGLSEQPFGSWFADRLKGLGVGLVLGSVALTGLYAAIRRAGARWWIWATGLVFVFNLFVTMIAPVFIAPLFNHYQPLPEGPVREAVLSLARANGIPTQHVEWFDASKQTTRISANVSGLWGTTRLSLNDNLMKRTSLPEIKAVLGHEMGHYVLDHELGLTIYLTIVYGVCLWLLHALFDRALARWGARLGLRDRADPAALPLAVAIVSTLLFLATPVLNGIVRQAENQADAYGLNAAREPYGFAMVSMRLATYRKIVPGPVEEMLFFDHPSGYERVHRAMVWLKENASPEYARQAGTTLMLGEVPIELRHGLPTVHVSVGGAPVDLYLDLGGFQGIALTPEELRRVKVSYREGAIQFRNAKGDVLESRQFTAPHVMLAGFDVGDVEGGETNFGTMGPPDRNGYIGMPVLGRYLMVLDYPHQRVRFYRSGDANAFEAECGKAAFPIAVERGIATSIVNTEFGPRSFIWDTGATDNFIRPSVLPASAAKGRRVDDGSPMVDLKQVALGSSDVGPQRFRLVPFRAPDVDGYLGTGLLANRKVCLDVPARKGAIAPL